MKYLHFNLCESRIIHTNRYIVEKAPEFQTRVMSYYDRDYQGQRFGSKHTQDVANWGYIILYLFVILGSLIGNGLFLFTIKKNQNLRRSHHFLLSSLAIRDLIVTILVIPFVMDSQVSLEYYLIGYFCRNKIRSIIDTG